jgi:hypothetical protein
MPESEKKELGKMTYHSLAYLVLLNERMKANPDYKVSDLNAELAAVGESLGAKHKGKK